MAIIFPLTKIKRKNLNLNVRLRYEGRYGCSADDDAGGSGSLRTEMKKTFNVLLMIKAEIL